MILTARANVVAGTQYHIKLAIADQTDTQYDAAIFLKGGSFASVTDLGNDRLIATGNPVCDGQTVLLTATNPDAIGYKWFKDGNPAILATTDSFTVSSGGTYSVEVQLASTCVSDGAITIEYTAPLSQGPYTITQCDGNNDGLTTFNLNDAGEVAINGTTGVIALSYHLSNNEAIIGMPQITNVNAFANTTANQKIYIRLQNEFGCTSVAEVILSTVSGTIISASPLTVCDEDGTEDGFTAIDLSQTKSDILAGLPLGLDLTFYTSYTDALTGGNAIADSANFTNTTADNQTIYARITNSADCYGITEILITVFTFPQDFTDETLTICAGSSLRLDAPAGFSYSWNTTPVQTTQSITVTEPGSYSVTLTGATICEKTVTFTVVQSGAATGAEIIAEDFTGGFNSVNIIPEGLGNYEFSIDGDNYQGSPVFANLVSGAYTIYIKDKDGCSPVYQEEFFILDYPKFFTPNGDGVNDVWRIPFMNNRPGITVTVYDRYGKLIIGFDSSSFGWDGTLNNKTLPASDYWFRIKLEDGRTIKGHFSLVR
ncbi:MAG: T9SS type B sorting domain-containing protein [Sphingobacteriales bacterium]|nr:MAG: T9SS type B sorting domain-containing protein [Sphingobacteriales bacterium]